METPETQNTTGTSLGDLLKGLRDDTTKLVREEVALAKTEIAENISRTLKNSGYLIGGAFIGLVALIMALLGSAKLATLLFIGFELDPPFAEMLGYFTVAIIAAIAAAAVIGKALDALKNKPLFPEKTIETIKEDTQWIKEKLH